MTCKGCIYADWVRTKTGRLSPLGDGRCRYEYRLPALPASMYWPGHRNDPTPSGGYIRRNEPLRRDCPYYKPEDNA